MDYIKNIIKENSPILFSTVREDGTPETRALENSFNARQVFNDDKIELYYGTHTGLDKTIQLENNNKASVYVSLLDFRNLTLFGTAEIVTDKAIKESLWFDELLEQYDGKDDEMYCLIKFTPNEYKYYDQERNKIEGEL
ncbi:MAG: hypothetical protein Ta2D_03170 [Rickettsiales bacterium]|nr:MAG: hypothetical protein Ta2D_03170 [Rickettsiales bacterium]